MQNRLCTMVEYEGEKFITNLDNAEQYEEIILDKLYPVDTNIEFLENRSFNEIDCEYIKFKVSDLDKLKDLKKEILYCDGVYVDILPVISDMAKELTKYELTLEKIVSFYHEHQLEIKFIAAYYDLMKEIDN